jgi:uncharacterized cupredoxin-like copper-binding protein
MFSQWVVISNDKKRIPMSKSHLFLAAGLLALAPVMAGADEPKDHSAHVKKQQKVWGIAGDAASVKRTIEMNMSDQMRFTPDRLEIMEGETVRLVLRNTGQLQHEFVLGTRQQLEAHAAMMAKSPAMAHEDPYTSHVAPGKTGEVVWTFNRPGEFDFACLVAGHYQAGMSGKVRVIARTKPASPAKAEGAHRH